MSPAGATNGATGAGTNGSVPLRQEKGGASTGDSKVTIMSRQQTSTVAPATHGPAASQTRTSASGPADATSRRNAPARGDKATAQASVSVTSTSRGRGRAPRRGERLYHRIAAVVTLALVAVMLWDDISNGGRWFVPLLILVAAHLVIELIVLVWLRPATEARIDHELAYLVEVPVEPLPGPEPAEEPEPKPAAPPVSEPIKEEGPFTYNGYTLYRTDTTDRGGNPRTFYFFSKRTPKRGTPAVRPFGHLVGVNRVTGLPFLKRGIGPDGQTLHAAKEAKEEQCQAITAGGTQCKFTSRARSRYCARHHGYRPPAADVAGAAKDTRPLRKKTVDTRPSSRAG